MYKTNRFWQQAKTASSAKNRVLSVKVNSRSQRSPTTTTMKLLLLKKATHLRTVLRLGHGDQELEDRLRLGHQGGDGVDDGGELGRGFDTCGVQEVSG